MSPATDTRAAGGHPRQHTGGRPFPISERAAARLRIGAVAGCVVVWAGVIAAIGGAL